MKSIALVIVVMCSLAFCSQNCGEKEKFPDAVDFTFVIPLAIVPIQETFKIGDTLWLSANFPDTVWEFHSGKYFKAVNYSFPTRIGFFKLISKEKYFSEQPGASASFKIVNKIGSADNFSSTFGDFKLQYNANRYKCSIGIIPQQPGVFCVNFLSPEDADLSFIDLGLTQDGRKRIANHKEFFYVINEGATNFNLFKENSIAVSLSVPIVYNIYYEQKGTFTFKVVQ